MPQLPSQSIHDLLSRWNAGDQKALEALVPLVYNELHRLAHHYLRDERSDHTLQTTALINEAYLRLVEQGPFRTQNRGHFVAVAATLMRQILVDYARSRQAAKRGADCTVRLIDGMEAIENPDMDVIALDDALKKLGFRQPLSPLILSFRDVRSRACAVRTSEESAVRLRRW